MRNRIVRICSVAIVSVLALSLMTLPASAAPVAIAGAVVSWIVGPGAVASVLTPVLTVAIGLAESVGFPYLAPSLHWSEH